MLIDTHCHLDFPEFDQDREEVILRAKNARVDYIVNVGSSLNSSAASVRLAEEHEFIYAVVGTHPHEADNFNSGEEAALRRLAKSNKVVGIGETGLDYYRNYSKARNQEGLFSSMLRMAKDFNLPLVVHSRDAQEDTLKILKDAMPIKAVVHCFSGGADFLKECLELGFFISFTCNITYKKAQALRDMVQLAPLERIFLETDAPYLSPEGLRGRRNEPLNVRLLAEEVARIKNLSVEGIAAATSANAKEFFNLR
jgi:TatD DNase family protein